MMYDGSNTSGNYAFAPSMGEAVLYAYGLCGVRNTALTQQHFETARMAANLMQGRWSSQGVNLWQVDLQCVPLQQGCATYPVPPNTIVMLDTYISNNSNQPSTIDRLILPISRTEYASYSNKQQAGVSTTYWFDRLLSPTVTLWPVPNGSSYNTLKYYRLRQTQDAVFTNGTSVELPTYFWEAFALGLAYRLALTYAPEKLPMLKPLADEAWEIAAAQNTETSSFYISPQLGGYYR